MADFDELGDVSARNEVRPREIAALAIAAAAIPLIGWAFWALVLHLGANDFHDYWLDWRPNSIVIGVDDE